MYLPTTSLSSSRLHLLGTNATTSSSSSSFSNKSRRYGRLLLLGLLMTLSTFLSIKLYQLHSLIASTNTLSKTNILLDFEKKDLSFNSKEISSTVSPYSEDDPAYLAPEWEWARETSIVYTWVNGSVPEYRDLRQKWGGVNAVGGGRDRDNDDLKFSLRTLHQFMPWHNGTIFLVSPEPPNWANPSNPRFKWISQDDLIPIEDQPTFNSNAVEQYLHLIPGLTDKFIQMNDDYMLFKTVHPSDFFTPQKGIRLFLEASTIRPHTFDTKQPPIWLGSTFHSVDMLRNAYGPIKNNEPRFLQHAPFVYYKQAFYNMHQRFYKSFRISSEHKFRHYDDVLTPLMHHGYVVQEGSHCCGMKYEIVPTIEAKKMMKFMKWGLNEEENANRLKEIQELSPKFFNVNDEMGNDPVKASSAQAQLKKAFISLFGNEPSPFEKKNVK